jgi:methionyl-tRNA formyltransferase
MKRPRVVYLSRGKWGPSLLRWLKREPCDVVYSDTENRRVEKFPDYDLGIAFLYGHRIPASEFDGRKLWVNFHSAPLPELRGREVAYHAIMQGASHFGATIHYMDATLDTGDLIEVQRFPIMPYHTAGDLVRRSHRLLIRLFRKHIPAILRSKVPSTPQEHGTYYSRTTISDYIELDARQELLIRALTVHPLHHARVRIGGRSFRIVPEMFSE